MVLVGRTARASVGDQQQDLIPGVGTCVECLGQHRARAGDQRRCELGHRDPDVRGERDDDRTEALSVGGWNAQRLFFGHAASISDTNERSVSVVGMPCGNTIG